MSIQITYNDPEDQKAYEEKLALLHRAEKVLFNMIKLGLQQEGKTGIFLEYHASEMFEKSKERQELHDAFNEFLSTLGESTVRILRSAPYTKGD